MNNYKHFCPLCGDDSELTQRRWAKGMKFCITCGDEVAKKIASRRCIVAPHKQGYMFFTDESAREIVKGINNKGGLIK